MGLVLTEESSSAMSGAGADPVPSFPVHDWHVTRSPQDRTKGSQNQVSLSGMALPLSKWSPRSTGQKETLNLAAPPRESLSPPPFHLI